MREKKIVQFHGIFAEKMGFLFFYKNFHISCEMEYTLAVKFWKIIKCFAKNNVNKSLIQFAWYLFFQPLPWFFFKKDRFQKVFFALFSQILAHFVSSAKWIIQKYSNLWKYCYGDFSRKSDYDTNFSKNSISK